MKAVKYLPLVNVKQGTASNRRFSHGNVLPLTQRPFGMASFAPQTCGERGPWFYHPDDRSVEGIRLTHQPSPWIGDYGCLVLLPHRARIRPEAECRWSGFRPNEAVLSPHFLKMRFLRYEATLSLTPAVRGAALELEFEGDEPAYLAVLPVAGEAGHRVEVQNRRVVGYTDHHTSDVAVNFRMHYVLEFDSDIDPGLCRVSDGTADSVRPGLSAAGPMAGVHVALKNKKVRAKLAISYIDESFALQNLDRELRNRAFEDLLREGEAVWEGYLSRIRAEFDDPEKLKTFYSCMYRLFLFPHVCYEYDEAGRPVHYSPHTGKTEPGVRYTDNGFWDTFRTVYPLFSLIARDEYAEMLEGFVNDYREGGWLPRWLSIGEVGCMPSTLIDAVIADAVVKGIGKREVWETALRGMLHHAVTDSPDPRYGRTGASDYRRLGYVPSSHKESVNLTLDAAYGDFCIAQTAAALGKTEIAEAYRRTARNYRNLFDPETGFMRSRDENGKMREPFDPLEWGGDYTEACAWQTTFAVPHDIEGLAELFGGADALEKKLDALFAEPPRYKVGGYGLEIHEMTETAALDLGQFAICNQPSFHLPYIYSALGKPEKAAPWIRKVVNEIITYKEDGFPGDEDNGTMAGWYIFSCLGLYPLCPGKPEFVKGVRVVRKATVAGKEWDWNAFGNVVSYFELI